MRQFKKALLSSILTAGLLTALPSHAADADTAGKKKVDASDPTKIYSFIGVGPRYTAYTNGEHTWELRTTGTLTLSRQDMAVFEIGYGWHDGHKAPGGNDGVTDGRVRWFHIFSMDYGKMGYRGWATQIDAQFQGSLKGTNGSNNLSLGGVAAYGLTPNWSLFLMGNLVNNWNKDFKDHQGVGLNISPLLVYKNDKWWDGAYVRLWPTYTRFVSGKLDNSGGATMQISVGGRITPTKTWVVVVRKNYDKDLNGLKNVNDAVLMADWDILFSVSTFF